jgi:hypothetical protein
MNSLYLRKENKKTHIFWSSIGSRFCHSLQNLEYTMLWETNLSTMDSNKVTCACAKVWESIAFPAISINIGQVNRT